MQNTKKNKKFKLTDAILSVICIVFAAEAAAPVASIGNSQYFWWIFLILFFLLPYGLISSELGTTYDGEGGLYDWIKRAFGNKWGARVSWYYWINYPLWMASLSIVFPEILGITLGVNIPLIVSSLISLMFIWIVVLISFYPVCDSIWILRGSAFIKIVLALVVGCLGVYGAITNGVANEYTFQSLLPSFDLHSLSFISVILFNFLGFEVICTFAKDMENPKKQIPQAIVIGGIVIALIYVFSAFGIGVSIPTSQISTSSGLIDSIQLLTGSTSGWFISLMSILFLLSLFGNMISWALGINNVACYAAENNDMPKVFSKRWKKNNMPIGGAIMNGIVATVIIVVAPFLPNQDLFWNFFSLNLIMCLLAYFPMFMAFLKLRETDPYRVRPFKVGGNGLFIKGLAVLPMIIIVISIVFLAVPLEFSDEALSSTLPITIGSIICIIMGEIMIINLDKKRKIVEEVKGS